MKCAILSEPGQPLEIADLPGPTPSYDELLVHVEACGVCHSDLHLVDGDWTGSLERRIRPTILGHEIVGMVVGRGNDVRGFDKGDRVGVGWVGATCGECSYCVDGDDNLCVERRITGIDLPGGFACLTLIKASQAIRVPDSLSSAGAAPLFCAGVTVYRGMKKAAITPGQRVAIYGVGGLGHIAVQLARMWGAEVSAVDLAPEKLVLAKEVGARHALDAETAVEAITAAGGSHIAVVTAASHHAYADAVRSLRTGGTLVVVGLPNQPLRLIADDIATHEIRIVGSAVGSRSDIKELLEMAERGDFRCITETLPLDQANEALDKLRKGEVRGRVVLIP